jgi:ATP-dependent Lon protease
MPSKIEKSSSAKYNLRNKRYRKKLPPPPSSEDDSYSSDEETIYSTVSEATCSDNEPEEPENTSKKFNRRDFQNMLATMFPSNYTKSKVAKNTTTEDAKPRREEAVIDKKEKRSISVSKKQKEKSKSSLSGKKHKSRSDSEESDIDIEDTECSEEEDDDERSDEDEDEYDNRKEVEKSSNKKRNKYSIILTIGGKKGKTEEGEEEDEDYEDMFLDDDSYEESDDEEQCNSEDEEAFMRENYEKIPTVVDEPKPETENTKVAPSSKKSSASVKSVASECSLAEETDIPEDIESEYLELLDIKKRLSAELAKRPANKILKRSVQECSTSIRELIKKARRKNTRKYRKLVYEDTRPTNEMEYFKRKLSHKEQNSVMNELSEIYSHIYTEKPYRLSLIQSKMPAKFKAIAMQKLNILRTMEPSDSEYYKIKNWVDTFMKIPFGIYKNVSVSMTDGVDKCNEFLVNAKSTLDNCTYGLNDAKMQIMQMLGQWMVNPISVGSAIAIHGPMGTGKTTLVKEGISKILGREFTFIALGGSGDASFLEGHSYTYEGSTWGKIVQILIDSKCMNPVIYFDELDKVSDTPRGQEIIGILTHLIDTSQNTQFHDKYFSEIDFDLSKCLFIFSYNDENLVNPILRDRMYHIRTKGYESKDKIVIARNYLLPKIREQVCFSETDVVIPDEMIQYIVTTFTKNESGVRNLKRCLEIIYSKLNLFRLVSDDNKMFTKDMNISIRFPITITKKEIDIFIKNDEVISQSVLAMYV